MPRQLRHEDRDGRERFPNLPAQVATTLCGGVFALLGLSGLAVGTTRGDQIWGAALLVFGAMLAGRSLVAPSIEVSPRGLVVRTMLRSRRLAWSDVSQLAIDEGSTGMASGQREFIVVELSDATTLRHKELNAPTGRRHRSPCRVHDAFAAADRELRRQRSISV